MMTDELFAKLKPETKRWVNRIRREFDLDAHRERLLTLAGVAWDDIVRARRLLDEEGPVVVDRFGRPKPHPAEEVSRHNVSLFYKLLREIGLDLEPPRESRPPGRPGGY